MGVRFGADVGQNFTNDLEWAGNVYKKAKYVRTSRGPKKPLDNGRYSGSCSWSHLEPSTAASD